MARMFLRPLRDDPELTQLIEKSKRALERMSPEEKASMYSWQIISVSISEAVMGIHEDGHDPRGVLASVDSVLKVFDGDTDAITGMFGIAARVWNLTPEDKTKLREHILEMRQEVADMIED